jgi:putative transposase
MRDALRTVAAVRLALSTRRELLLESLALRHQLGVLARSNRRFRASDRLLWLLLRRLWPRWREALVLVRPATVDRWRRDGFGRCWRRRSGRAGRPRIDSQSRDLIRRLAAENHLWGAPRIHGELLKLGIAVSERTVSRYLQGRPKARSQTWRTFFANHLSDRAFMPPGASSVATDDDVVVDASGFVVPPGTVVIR